VYSQVVTLVNDIKKNCRVDHHHYHHHVHERLGVFLVPWSSKWNWSLHLFLGRFMFLLPFGLYRSVCFGILFVSILCMCCTYLSWYCFIFFTIFPAPVFSLIYWVDHHHYHHHVHERLGVFLVPQNEIGPSISSSVVLCSFFLLVYIVVFVLVFHLCPSSVCVVPTYPGTVLFSLLYSLLPFFPLIHCVD